MKSLVQMVSGRSSVIKAMSVGVTNQIITAATNFLLSLYLIVTMSISEFGVFGIMLALSEVLKGLANSGLLTQMVVLYPDKPVEQRNAYVASILNILVLLSVISFIVAGVGAFCLLAMGIISSELATAGMLIVLFSSAQIIKEFYVRLAYTHRVEMRALRIHVVVSIVLAILIALSIPFGFEQSALLVILIYSLAMFAGAIFGQFELRLPLRTSPSSIWSSLSESWIGGKWSMVNDVFYSTRHESHTLLTAALVGPTGVGLLNASKLFLKPIKQITPSLSQVYLARQVSLRQSDPLQLLRNGLWFSLFNIGCVALYGLALYWAFPLIAPHILSGDTEGIEAFVLAWLIVSLITAGRYGLESTQKALKRFKALTAIGLPVAILSVVFVYLGIRLLGPVGAIYGYGLGELFLVIALFIMMHKTAARIRAESPAS